MSSRAKAIENNIIDSRCRFPVGMYTIFPGSVLICYSIFEKPSEEKTEEIKALWFKVQKHPSKYYKTAEDYYNPKYTLKIFGLKNTYEWPVAVVVGKHNTLLAPFVVGENDIIKPLPIREDGNAGPTIRHPVSVHPLQWGENTDVSDNSNSDIQEH